jgi:hypothetical protein
MSGVSGSSVGLSAGVELKGHLIDSLTLSKVIDLVQQLGGDYQLNDIRVGSLKKDISSINMTLHASNQAIMDQLLAAIAPYGAVVGSDQEEPQTVTCEQAGRLPEGVFGVKMPRRVYYQGGWQDVANGGLWALVLEGSSPRVKPVSDLRQGDKLVSGTHGLQW